MSENIKTWQDRLKDDQRTFAMDVCMQAEIADLRAALAQRAPADEALVVDFDSAVNAVYPYPDSPHGSVIQRATDARTAFRKGWDARHPTPTKADEAQGAVGEVKDRGDGTTWTQIFLNLPAGTKLYTHAQPTAEEVTGGDVEAQAATIRDLDAISMALGARLVQMHTNTIKGNDYLLRDAVMREVCEWRRMWDKNSAARPPIARPPDRSRPSGNAGEGVQELKPEYKVGDGARANAGPSPGDMPIDRFIAAMPLPQYPATAEHCPNPIVLGSPIGEFVARCPEADAYLDEHAKRAEPSDGGENV